MDPSQNLSLPPPDTAVKGFPSTSQTPSDQQGTTMSGYGADAFLVATDPIPQLQPYSQSQPHLAPGNVTADFLHSQSGQMQASIPTMGQIPRDVTHHSQQMTQASVIASPSTQSTETPMDVDDDIQIRVVAPPYAIPQGPSTTTLADVISGPQGTAAVDHFLKIVPTASAKEGDVTTVKPDNIMHMTPPASSAHSDLQIQRGQDFIHVPLQPSHVAPAVAQNILQITPPASSIGSQERPTHESSASIAASTSSAVTQSATGNEFAVRITRPDGTFIDYNVLPNYGDYIKEVCKAGEVSDDVRSVPSIPAPPPSVRLHTRGVVRGQPAALAQGSEGRQAALTLYSDTSASLASTQASQQQTPRDTAADVLTGYVDLSGNYISLREEYIDMQREQEILSLESLENRVRQRRDELLRQRQKKISSSLAQLNKETDDSCIVMILHRSHSDYCLSAMGDVNNKRKMGRQTPERLERFLSTIFRAIRIFSRKDKRFE